MAKQASVAVHGGTVGATPSLPDFLFPDSARVIYRRAPLRTVICQLRFPPILRIEATPPADFQDRIRAKFPLLQKVNIAGLEQVPEEVAQALGLGQAKATYQFKTDDQAFTVSLDPGSLSLTTSKYTRWEEFRNLFEAPISALIDVYKPAFFNRIGLRYTNVILRSEANLVDQPWTAILSPQIAGELNVRNWERCVRDIKRVTRLIDPDGDGVLFQQGFSRVNKGSEEGYLLDFDLYRDGRTNIADALARLDAYHRRAGRAFRWCISDLLHRALEPTELGDNQH